MLAPPQFVPSPRARVALYLLYQGKVPIISMYMLPSLAETSCSNNSLSLVRPLWFQGLQLRVVYNVFSDVIFYSRVLQKFRVSNNPSASMSCILWWSGTVSTACFDFSRLWSENISVRDLNFCLYAILPAVSAFHIHTPLLVSKICSYRQNF